MLVVTHTWLHIHQSTPRQDVTVQVSVLLESGSKQAFVAARVNTGGCSIHLAQGVYFWIDTAGYWNMTSKLGESHPHSFRVTASHFALL